MQIDGCEDFKASNGWAWTFKRRHGLRQVKLQGERLEADDEAATLFTSSDMKKILESVSKDQLYNAGWWLGVINNFVL